MVTKAKIEVFAEPFQGVLEAENNDSVAVLLSAHLSALVPIERVETANLGPAHPERLLLGALRDGRLRVRSPISVRLTSENRDFVAEAEELTEFGFGKNPSEALIDLQNAIAELYFTLQQEQGRLGPDLELVWANLERKLDLKYL